MTLAVGQLSDAINGTGLGTVFAVTDRLALTGFHCVGDRETGQIRVRRVRCTWGLASNDAVVLEIDVLNDVALLQLTHALPTGLSPVELVRDVPVHEQFVAPGEPAAVVGVAGFAVSGRITWTQGHLEDGARVIQLACEQSAAGLSLQGLSGAPVLVGEPQKAVGVIRWNPPREDRPELAVGASAFAAPSKVVLDRWPQLDSSELKNDLALSIILRHLIARDERRSTSVLEFNVRQLLRIGDLDIGDEDLRASLNILDQESHIIDLEGAAALIRVRPDLRVSDIEIEAAEQHLFELLTTRNRLTGRRYVGILTDGVEWHLYRRAKGGPQHIEAAKLTLDPSDPDIHVLLAWLEAILATRQQIKPTPQEIAYKLGAGSPSYALDFAELMEIYANCKDLATVTVKRQMWAKLLTTASGTHFTDDDALFVDHTLLVATAKVIGHAVLGFFQPGHEEINASEIMSGAEFAAEDIGGVVESDFFDWIVDNGVHGGKQFVDDLVRRLTRFAWDKVEHDVMKILYESIIPEQTRHSLGEYYTPDWLAEYIINECVTDPLTQRILDASSGSGTFLFHAVRRYTAAAENAGRSNSDIISGVVRQVIGLDVQPVAVMLARVTYLLAIGMSRLQNNRPEFAIPIYLCDSLRWGQETTLWSYEGLSVRTTLDHAALLYDPEYTNYPEFADSLKFPDSVIANTDLFDQLVAELSDKACERERDTPPPPLAATFNRFSIHEGDQAILEQTFQNMCDLHDAEKDHIWGYFVRNLARPVWLARPDNRVDVLIGNPPWLSYRYMTEVQKGSFRAMSTERGLWAGGQGATNHDLSALFVMRCIELYLRPGGRFGYVMPLAALTRNPYAGFRLGGYSVQAEVVKIAFDRPWDLHRVKPAFFRQAVGVILGHRELGDGRAVPLDGQVSEVWSGRFQTKTATMAEADAYISRIVGELPPEPSKQTSLYARRFSQGATMVPRFLFFVEEATRGPLSGGSNRRPVQSLRSASEKMPWKGLPSLRGAVEEQFILPALVGDSILPFFHRSRLRAVIPWDESRNCLFTSDEAPLETHRGLAAWWRAAEAVWMQYRSSERLDLRGRLDYHRGLSRQFPIAGHRVVYSASGMYIAAAIISGSPAIIEHKLYWGAMESLEEAKFLTAILNSTTLTGAVRHLQGRGEHNPRDFDKYIFQLPIPLYNPNDSDHRDLVALADQAGRVATGVALPPKRFEAQRREVREALARDGVVSEIDSLVKTFLR